MSEQRESDYEYIARAIWQLGSLLCIGMIFIGMGIADSPSHPVVGFGIFMVILILFGLIKEDKERRKTRRQNSGQEGA